MDRDIFWEIVDEARADAGEDDETFLRGVESQLQSLPPNAIAGFREQLDAALAEAYRWDLWGASYLMNGVASDDGFEYFRAWLVSRGSASFEAALRDPDTLAALVSEDPEWSAEFEEFLYLPVYVYEQKTGEEIPLPEVMGGPEGLPEPSGDPLDEGTVSARLPLVSQKMRERHPDRSIRAR